MGLTLEERLNEELNEKQNEINKLNSKLEKFENDKRLEKLIWMAHSSFENKGLSKTMPYPRLEMRLERISLDNWYEIEWVYGLVYRHLNSTFLKEENETLLFIPFSRTTSNGGNGRFESFFHDNKLDLPFRDGLHIKSEANLLNLPAYIVCYEKNIAQEIDVKLEGKTDELMSKMRHPVI